MRRATLTRAGRPTAQQSRRVCPLSLSAHPARRVAVIPRRASARLHCVSVSFCGMFARLHRVFLIFRRASARFLCVYVSLYGIFARLCCFSIFHLLFLIPLRRFPTSLCHEPVCLRRRLAPARRVAVSLRRLLSARVQALIKKKGIPSRRQGNLSRRQGMPFRSLCTCAFFAPVAV